jgi:hypothetical protein
MIVCIWGGGTVQERGEARERGTAYIKKEKKNNPLFLDLLQISCIKSAPLFSLPSYSLRLMKYR